MKKFLNEYGMSVVYTILFTVLIILSLWLLNSVST